MRYDKEARVRFVGDKSEGVKYVSLARTFLGNLIAQNHTRVSSPLLVGGDEQALNTRKGAAIDLSARTVQLSNGVTISVEFNTWVPILTITVPPVGVEIKEIPPILGGYVIRPWARGTEQFGNTLDSLLEIREYLPGVPPIPHLDTTLKAGHVTWSGVNGDKVYSYNPGSVTFDRLNEAAVRYSPSKWRWIYHPNSKGRTLVYAGIWVDYDYLYGSLHTGHPDIYYRNSVITTLFRVVAVGEFNGDLFAVGREISAGTPWTVYRRIDGEWVSQFNTGITERRGAVLFSKDGSKILFTHSRVGMLETTCLGCNGYNVINPQLTVVQIFNNSAPKPDGSDKYLYNMVLRTHPVPYLHYIVPGSSYIFGTSTGEDHSWMDWDDDNLRIKSLFERTVPDSFCIRDRDESGDRMFAEIDWQSEVVYSKFGLGSALPGTIEESLNEGEEAHILGTYGTQGLVEGRLVFEQSCLATIGPFYDYTPTGELHIKQFLLVDADLRYDTICYIEREMMATPNYTVYVCPGSVDAGPSVGMNLTYATTSLVLKVWRKGEIIYEETAPVLPADFSTTWSMIRYTVYNDYGWVDEFLGLAHKLLPVQRYNEILGTSGPSSLTDGYPLVATFLCRDPYSFVLSVRWFVDKRVRYNNLNRDPYASKAVYWQQPPGAETGEVYDITELLAQDGLDLDTPNLDMFTVFPIRAV